MKRSHLLLALLLGGSLVLVFSQCQSGQQPSTDISIAESFETALADVVERSRPAVVSISANANVGSRSRFGFESIPVTGAGFIFRPEGYLLTNEHVVSGSRTARVRFTNGNVRNARVIGSDPNTDIAVLKIEAMEGDDEFPSLKLGDSDSVRVGQFAVSLGNPLRLNFSANIGIVSAKGRQNLIGRQTEDDKVIRYQDFIQTDAYMNVGNSGGPLLNLRGEVVGINTMIRTRQSSDQYIGLGFAIPSNIAQIISDQLIERGRIVRGWLGISYQTESEGILVQRVMEESPAGEAGFQPNDIIVAIDSKPLDAADPNELQKQFQWMIAMSPVGKKMRFKTLRGGAEIDIDVILSEMPAEHAGREAPRYPLTAQLGFRGVKKMWPNVAADYHFLEGDVGAYIGKVTEDSAADQAGIREGDLVTEVNGKAVSSPAELESALFHLTNDEKEKTVSFTVKSPGEAMSEPSAREAAIPIEALRK